MNETIFLQEGAGIA